MTEPRAATAGPRADTDRQEALRVRAAWLYHVEGMTQSEVAATLGVNRIMITRLLAEARARGEVIVRLRSGIAPIVELERDLERRFALRPRDRRALRDRGRRPRPAPSPPPPARTSPR